MKKKIIEWLKRYGPAEIFATIGALIGAFSVFALSKNQIISAYAGMIGENIGYYGTLIFSDALKSIRIHKKKKTKYGFRTIAEDARNIILEFGFSEALDSLLVRPFCMYIFPVILNNYGIGIIIGKIVADVIFYIPTIISYELRKKHLD